MGASPRSLCCYTPWHQTHVPKTKDNSCSDWVAILQWYVHRKVCFQPRQVGLDSLRAADEDLLQSNPCIFAIRHIGDLSMMCVGAWISWWEMVAISSHFGISWCHCCLSLAAGISHVREPQVWNRGSSCCHFCWRWDAQFERVAESLCTWVPFHPVRTCWCGYGVQWVVRVQLQMISYKGGIVA